MLKEFVDRIQELSRKPVETVESREYSTIKLEPVKEPLAAVLKVNTLAAIVNYIHENRDNLSHGSLMLHIEGHDQVDLISSLSNKWRQREVLMSATLENYAKGFGFGSFMDKEEFLIQLQSRFAPSLGRDQLLAFAGNMTANKVQENNDDGITQTVSMKAGVVLAAAKPVPNPVALKPFRTFVELDQPESSFIFRVRDGRDGMPPQCALFEADGGKWKLDAIMSIKKFLGEKLPVGISIIA